MSIYKQIALFLLLVSAPLFAGDSSLKIGHDACMKIKYGGGSPRARTVLERRLIQKLKASLPHSDEEALATIRRCYPQLKVDKLRFVIRNCRGYYVSDGHYFDPVTLQLIKR